MRVSDSARHTADKVNLWIEKSQNKRNQTKTNQNHHKFNPWHRFHPNLSEFWLFCYFTLCSGSLIMKCKEIYLPKTSVCGSDDSQTTL